MRPHGRRAHVNPTNPEAFAQCDRCGFWYNRSQLLWQYEWSGTDLINTGKLVCRAICLDVPQEQLRTILLPPDPPSILNARPPNFTYQEAGPVQGVLAATALRGSNTLVLQPANGSLNDASSFAIGDVVWVQLVDAAYSANISFGQYQIFNIDVSANTLFVHDLLTAAGIVATAPINGTVTFAVHPIIPPPVQVLPIEATFHGGSSIDAQQLRPPVALISVLGPDGVPKEPYEIAGAIFAAAVMTGSGGAGEAHTPTVWFASAGFSGTGG
jgi:hypothetical protein